MRVVSLTCSNTEIVCALGCSHMLVGVDNHSDFPEEIVRDLPRVGPDLNIDIEKVKALKPDLVLASLTVPGHENVVASLQDANLNYIAPEPLTLNDVYTDIRTIAEHLGCTETAVEVIESMQEVMKANSSDTAPRLLIQWWPKPVIAPGNESWVHEMLELAGGENPLGDQKVKSLPLENSDVVRLNPDAIIISWCGVAESKYRPEVIYRNPDFTEINAVKRKQVFCISEAYLGRPSPRLTTGYKKLREIIEAL